MTVTYTAKVATVKFVTLWKLLRRWRGSVYKNLWKDWLVFASLYFVLSFIYRVILNNGQRRTFERVALFCDRERASIPVAFILGFYVSVVLTRWWNQVNDVMPWPDNFALMVTAFVHGNDDRGRLMRRTVLRYVNLSWILALCSISSIAKKRFPTLDHLVEIGVMTKNEQQIFDSLKVSSNKYYVPLVWATTLLSRARKEDRIHDDISHIKLIKELCSIRQKLGTLFNYDWIGVPLVYTQVVTIAVQAYFLASVLGGQFLDPSQGYPGHEVDIYIPVFMFLEFLFYMGWLKVAESLLNPFGEDDDDFDTNWVLDRNIQVSYLIVDDMHSEHPELIKDAYWDAVEFTLPYTAAAEQFKMEPYLGSTWEIELNAEDAQFVPMVPVTEDTGGEIRSVRSSNATADQNKWSVKSSLQKMLNGLKRPTQNKGNVRGSGTNYLEESYNDMMDSQQSADNSQGPNNQTYQSSFVQKGSSRNNFTLKGNTSNNSSSNENCNNNNNSDHNDIQSGNSCAVPTSQDKSQQCRLDTERQDDHIEQPVKHRAVKKRMPKKEFVCASTMTDSVEHNEYVQASGNCMDGPKSPSKGKQVINSKKSKATPAEELFHLIQSMK